MASTTPDLWPANLGIREVIPPIAILREQSALLEQKTNEALQGVIETVSSEKARLFRHDFYIRAAALRGYRYLLFSVLHGVKLYPAEILDTESENLTRCEDQEAFQNALQEILADEETQQLIATLIAQSIAA
jgi:hypothetical protein